MNFVGKGTGGDTRGDSFEEDGGGGEEEITQITGPTGQLFPSSSSSSPSSHHHHHHHHNFHHQNQNQHQPPNFHPHPSYHHQTLPGGWMHGGGEPSSSRLADPMLVDYSSAPDNNNNNSNSNIDDQQSGGGTMMVVEREHMFDKVVTPSDVGKLNRLVIPKQHAERYFPLDSSTNDKGLLLNFEDRNGKPWRFRYSYWNSSQSYVMTKGWSRFVKDKKLDAGDIVSFQRGVGGSAKDRLFIDWRHRPDAPAPPPPYHLSSHLSFPHNQFSVNRNHIHPWNPLFLQSPPPSRISHSNLMLQPSLYRYGNTSGPYQNIGTGSVVNVNQGGSGSVIYFRSGGGGGSGIPQYPQQQQNVDQRNNYVVGDGNGNGMDRGAAAPTRGLVFESVPVVHGKAAAKRLRLFGVNMDCPISDEDDQEYDQTTSETILSPTMVSSSSTHVSNPNFMVGNYHHPPPATSSSTIPYLQLSPYGGEEEEEEDDEEEEGTQFNKTTKSSSSASRMTLDLDI
ncbi:hypothetical protein SSX86_004948 [Deinandra increscens subsp. villosa]|uniref:TF-B3 domain-containing protein n=1 Tax=Deinandra increscens subsp. villosa TaxID=3103831 RepID=A0AAP0DSX4_9ASTR